MKENVLRDDGKEEDVEWVERDIILGQGRT